MSWPRDMTDCTLLLDQSSFAVHDMRDITSKEVLASDYHSYCEPSREVNKKPNMLVFLLCGHEVS